MTQQIREYREVLDRIKFRDWKFWTHDHMVGFDRTTYLQVEFDALPAGSLEGFHEPQTGRKWLLSPHMTDGEIVQTALMAILAALEHEVREEFTYRGQAIFGPHYDLEILVSVCETGHGDIKRTPPPAIDESDPQTRLLSDIEPLDPFRRSDRYLDQGGPR